MPDHTLHIRPATAADKDPVLAFIAADWEGDDYIAEVWDDWLGDAAGPLLVGTLDGAPVALTKLSDLGLGVDWIHGVRVAPELRGQGYGRLLVEHCLDLARQRGSRVARLMTSAENLAMQGVVERLGFRLAADYVWFSGAPLPAQEPLVALGPERLAEIQAQVAASAGQPPPLYCVGWRFLALAPERMARHLAAGQIVGRAGGAAWALVVADDELWVGYALGPTAELIELLRLIRAMPASGGAAVRTLVSPWGHLAAPLEQAGYRDEGHGERCYELALA